MLGELSLKLETLQRVTPRPVKHRAFTDLTKWQGKYYVAFRQSEHHMAYDGRLMVMSSEDLKRWQTTEWSAKCGLSNATFLDMGDRLFLYGIDRRGGKRYVCIVGSDGSVEPPQVIDAIEKGSLWRVKRIADMYYGTIYFTTSPREADTHSDSESWLLCSEDGTNWKTLSLILRGQEATETELLNDGRGNLLAFIRRDGPRFPTLAVGFARPPFTTWDITETDRIIHAVAACHWKGQIILVGRSMEEVFPNRHDGDDAEEGQIKALKERLNRKVSTKIWSWSSQSGLTELLTLPSQGDCSYAGIVPEKDRLVISYYSQHEQIAADPDFSTLQGGAEVFVCTVT